MKRFFVQKKWIFLGILIFCALALLPAQTAAEIETLLSTPSVTYAQAARFVLKASDAAQVSSPQEALNFAQEKKWLPADATLDTPARLDEISLLFMQSFGIKGGLFYSIFKTPHYAYRELRGMSAVQSKSFPKHTVSGEHLLYITSRLLSITGNE